jgi:methylated-DNA-[protein]-cysteine S-methyltransferase
VTYAYLETPIGTLLIVGDDAAVHRITFPDHGRAVKPEPEWQESQRGPVGEAARQLREYFAGERAGFDLPLAPAGTAFQCTVWRQLQELPYRETISYGELARRVGNSKASRAVGSANGANPLPIVIPCHRVIAGDGTLGGFAGGLPTKQTLIALELWASLANRAAAGRLTPRALSAGNRAVAGR